MTVVHHHTVELHRRPCLITCIVSELRISTILPHLLQGVKRSWWYSALSKFLAITLERQNQLASEYCIFSCNSCKPWSKIMENIPTCASRNANLDGGEGFTAHWSWGRLFTFIFTFTLPCSFCCHRMAITFRRRFEILERGTWIFRNQTK